MDREEQFCGFLKRIVWEKNWYKRLIEQGYLHTFSDIIWATYPEFVECRRSSERTDIKLVFTERGMAILDYMVFMGQLPAE